MRVIGVRLPAHVILVHVLVSVDSSEPDYLASAEIGAQPNVAAEGETCLHFFFLLLQATHEELSLLQAENLELFGRFRIQLA